MARNRGQSSDQYTEKLLGALEAYEQEFPGAQAELYRQNPASVRIRIIDPRFEKTSRADRHDRVWDFLQSHSDEDTMAEVSVLVLLPPKDVDSSMANYDFEHPLPSQL